MPALRPTGSEAVGPATATRQHHDPAQGEPQPERARRGRGRPRLPPRRGRRTGAGPRARRRRSARRRGAGRGRAAADARCSLVPLPEVTGPAARSSWAPPPGLGDDRQQHLDEIAAGVDAVQRHPGPAHAGPQGRPPARRPHRGTGRGTRDRPESTSTCSPVSASSTTIRPTSGSASSAPSTTRSATTSLRCASRISGRSHSPVPMKSEITTTRQRRARTRPRRASRRGRWSPPLGESRSALELPSDPQRMAASGAGRDDARGRAGVVEHGTDPVAVAAEQPGQDERELGQHVLLSAAGPPTTMDADRSRTSQVVSSRSSLNSRTCGSSSRAVTFQSMCRASSPSTYGRNPAKSRPLPRRGVR